MKFKYDAFVDADQNIVVRLDTIYTPEEFLLRNSEVYNFAQKMKPGARIEKKEHLLIGDDAA